MTKTTTVDVTGMAVIAADTTARKNKENTAKIASALILHMLITDAEDSAAQNPLKETDTVTTITTTAHANMMAVIAAASQVREVNLATAKSARARILKGWLLLFLDKNAQENAPQAVNSEVMDTAMTATTTVGANTMAVIAVARQARKTNFNIATHANVSILKKQDLHAMAKDVKQVASIKVMGIAMMPITTVHANLTAVIAAERKIKINTNTVQIVLARIQVWLESLAQESAVQEAHSKAMATAMTATTTADANTMAVIAVEPPGKRIKRYTVYSASA